MGSMQESRTVFALRRNLVKSIDLSLAYYKLLLQLFNFWYPNYITYRLLLPLQELIELTYNLQPLKLKKNG